MAFALAVDELSPWTMGPHARPKFVVREEKVYS
jgi:hypothetical protein